MVLRFAPPLRQLAFLGLSLLIGLGHGPSVPPVAAEELSLNLKNADIQALIETVAEMTGRNFVVDPRVKGKVTVVSADTLDREAVYNVFQSILEVHGYATVEADGITKVVPDVNAKQGPIPTGSGDDNRWDDVISRVIQVENVPAAQLVPILRPLVPQQGHLAAYTPSNVLVLTDRAANIRRLVSIIERIDQSTDSEVEVVRLENATASEVIQTLNSLKQQDQGRGNRDQAFFAADERTNSILISGSEQQRLELRALIAHLDTPLERTGNTEVVYLQYAKATDLVSLLEGIQTSRTEGDNQQANDAVFNIQADEMTNALVITAPSRVQKELKAVINKLDIRRAQVLVETIVAEVTTDRARELGVEAVLDNTPASGQAPVAATPFGEGSLLSVGQAVLTEDLGGVAGGGLGNGLSLAVGDFNREGADFGFLLRALNSDAATNILSTPSIMTLDNEEAEIVVGQNVPFITGQFTDTGGNAATPQSPFQTIERQNVGLTLKVTPQINEGGAIRLGLEVESSSLSASAVNASDLITNERSINTNVLVEDGQLIVLGGLIDDTTRDNIQKVPVLGDIPLLGNLFRFRSSSRVKQNLMVFMRPVILKDAATTSQYSHEKYRYMREQQRLASEQNRGLFQNEPPAVLPVLDEFLVNESRVTDDSVTIPEPK